MYKFNQPWPYPEPIEGITKNFCDGFYKPDQAHTLAEHHKWGNVQPSMDAKQDPGAHNRMYRTQLWQQYNWRAPNIWTNWAGVVGSKGTWSWLKWEPRDTSFFNIPGRYYNSGQLDYRDNKMLRTHDFLLADNWKPVTSEEQVAMKERLEIMGRNRRYMWKLKFHPKYENYFSYTASDAAYARWNRINSQFWYIFNVRKDRRDVIRHCMMIYVIPFGFAWAVCHFWFHNGNTKYGRRVQPVCPKYGVHPEEYAYGDNLAPKNQLTRHFEGQEKSKGLGYLLSFLFTSHGDQHQHIQFDQWKRAKAYAKGEPQPEVWPARPVDWDLNSEAYWNTKDARHAGSGFDPNGSFWGDKAAPLD